MLISVDRKDAWGNSFPALLRGGAEGSAPVTGLDQRTARNLMMGIVTYPGVRVIE